MIIQRYNLFSVGYSASLPHLYFSKLKIKETFPIHEDSEIQKLVSDYFQTFDKDKDANCKHLTNTIALAKDFDFHDFVTPHTSVDYFKWLDELVIAFEQLFPLSRIEHYYFLYARRIAELVKNMGLIKTYVDLQLNCKQTIEFTTKIESSIKDCEFIVFKLMAPAALLSSEPRQSCFNEFYKKIAESMQVFKELNIANASAQQLLMIRTEAENFSNMLTEGYDKCISALNELKN